MAEFDSEGRPIRRGAYPELTLVAVVAGYVLGIVITISWGSQELYHSRSSSSLDN